MMEQTIWSQIRERSKPVDRTDEMTVLGVDRHEGSIHLECACGHRFWFHENTPKNRMILKDKVHAECPTCELTWDGTNTECYGLFVVTPGDEFDGLSPLRVELPMLSVRACSFSEAWENLIGQWTTSIGSVNSHISPGCGMMVLSIPPAIHDMTIALQHRRQRASNGRQNVRNRMSQPPHVPNPADEAVAVATGTT